eukprot:g7730.t1
MQTGAPPPINFAAHVNDAEIKRAKKIYEKVQESMVLPRYITTEFLNKHDFKSGELYVNWEQAWERAVQGLSPYLKYKALTMTMTKGSAAHTAMENALRSAGFAALPTAQKYATIKSAIQSTASAELGILNLKKLYEKERQKELSPKEFFTQKVNKYDQIQRADPTYNRSARERVAIFVKTLKESSFRDAFRQQILGQNWDQADDALMTQMGELVDRITTSIQMLQGDSPPTAKTTETEDDVAAVTTLCDYCSKSRNPEVKAKAGKCPGRFGVEYVKGNPRNVNCPILHLNREKRKERGKKSHERNGSNEHTGRKRGRDETRDNNQRGGKTCFNCGRPGHLARDCRAPKRESRNCYSCGKQGHLAHACPNNQQQNHHNHGNNHNNNGDSNNVNNIGARPVNNAPAWTTNGGNRSTWGRETGGWDRTGEGAQGTYEGDRR